MMGFVKLQPAKWFLYKSKLAGCNILKGRGVFMLIYAQYEILYL